MSQSSLVVLVVLIGLNNGTITTKVHHKPTDGNQFVNWSSGHPLHLRRSISYAQLLRLKRICSDERDFEAEAKTLLTKFKSRVYPTDVLTRALCLAKQRTSESLLSTNTRTQTSNEALFFVTRYDERNHLQMKKGSEGTARYATGAPPGDGETGVSGHTTHPGKTPSSGVQPR